MQKSGLDKWPLIGQHPLLLDVQKRACRVANSELPVNISGETGTGKELLARYIHGISHRNMGPFVTVDCGLLTSEIARSELFGYVRGAFTGASETRLGLIESARGGTLFLDEIGELSSDLQLQLLRLVQEQEFRRVGEASMRRSNVRLITATHCNLRKMVREGTFREDLFYRLNVVPHTIAALAEATERFATFGHAFLPGYERIHARIFPRGNSKNVSLCMARQCSGTTTRNRPIDGHVRR